ncbi:MAG: hypothetical protein ACI379_16240 [Nocardioides sp.]|uniref:hypothetical protein n=1 Tax=Nocardioides sp. TaxID=35761 RepID=UPI003F07E7A2
MGRNVAGTKEWGVDVVEEFVARVRAACVGTPYTVTRTAQGFDLHLDLDGQWVDEASRGGLRRSITQRVTAAPPTYTVEQVVQEVHWDRGRPRLSAGGSVTKGRTIPLGHTNIWTELDDGTVGRLAPFTFNAEEGRDLVVLVGQQLGLEVRRSTPERIGLYAALAVPVLLAVCVVGVLIGMAVGVVPTP